MKKHKEYTIESKVVKNADGISSGHHYITKPFNEQEFLLGLDQNMKLTRAIEYRAYTELKNKYDNIKTAMLEIDEAFDMEPMRQVAIMKKLAKAALKADQIAKDQ